MDTYQRDGRGSVLHRCLCASAVEFSRSGGGEKGQVSVERHPRRIHARGTGGEPCCASADEFSRTGGRCFLADILQIGGGALVYACQRVGRASGLNRLFLRLRRSIFPKRKGGDYGRSLQSAAALLVDTCQRDGRGCALNSLIFLFCH